MKAFFHSLNEVVTRREGEKELGSSWRRSERRSRRGTLYTPGLAIMKSRQSGAPAWGTISNKGKVYHKYLSRGNGRSKRECTVRKTWNSLHAYGAVFPSA